MAHAAPRYTTTTMATNRPTNRPTVIRPRRKDIGVQTDPIETEDP